MLQNPNIGFFLVYLSGCIRHGVSFQYSYLNDSALLFIRFPIRNLNLLSLIEVKIIHNNKDAKTIHDFICKNNFKKVPAWWQATNYYLSLVTRLALITFSYQYKSRLHPLRIQLFQAVLCRNRL